MQQGEGGEGSDDRFPSKDDDKNRRPMPPFSNALIVSYEGVYRICNGSEDKCYEGTCLDNEHTTAVQ